MSITADLNGKNYVLGRGRVYFDRYDSNATIDANTVGQGELYFGNTPEFNTTSDSENLEHFDSDDGIKVKDDAVQLTMNRSGTFKCDNIASKNVALYFLSDVTAVAQAAAVDTTYQVTVKPGLFYQIGADAANPTGDRLISNVTIGKGVGFATDVPTAGNWQVDEVLGRLYVLPESTDIDAAGTLVQITYDTAAGSREQIVSSSDSIYGALRFVANNPKGENKDYYFPYVKLAPDGDYNLKGDDWQVMGFKFEILTKASNIKSVYIDGRAVAE